MFGVLGREGVDVHDGVKVGGPDEEDANFGAGLTVAVVVSVVVGVSIALSGGTKGGCGGGGRGGL